jgi:pimeloyl-ACP methyl ester carboxylesterase
MTKHTVTSTDSTRLAVDVVGAGHPLILVGGAFSYRRWPGFVELASLLADSFTVYGYDRRGRGDSDPGPSTSVDLEIDDLAAVVEAAGGDAHIFGMSSGGVLALRSMAAGVPARSAIVYQPPFMVTAGGHLPPADFGSHLASLVEDDRRSAAVRYFMTRGMGAPAFVVGMMRFAPFWKNLEAVAHTLPADHAIMGDTLSGRPLGRQPWSKVAAPTLVLDGAKSGPAVAAAADELANRLPSAERRTLPGQSHNVSMRALADAIVPFALRTESVVR